MDPPSFLLNCQCEYPGFCPVYKRIMGAKPPDWIWCQKTSPTERQKYYDMLQKAPPSDNQDIINDLKNYKGDKKWFYLDYLTLSKKYHYCSLANDYQKDKNKQIYNYIYSQKIDDIQYSKLQILCLGHDQKQFNSISDAKYLKKINLNEINAGKYSHNKWAEARAFLCPDLFDSEKEYIGFVTASWNIKYQPFCRIDNFTNWNTAKVLLNSKAEDKIVLCADIFCPCIWFQDHNNVLSVFLGGMSKDIGYEFLETFGINFTKHIKAPVSNQLILHIDNYQKYYSYLIDNDIYAKLDNFIEQRVKKNIHIQNNLTLNYSYPRINGYFMEMLTCFWFASQDFLFLPNTERKDNWYQQNNILSRINTKTANL